MIGVQVLGTWGGTLASLASAGFVLLLGIAALYDLKAFRIPNAIPALILAVFALHAVAAPEAAAFAGGLLAGLATLAGGFGLFCLRAMGGGDVKLLAAAALWLGWPALPAFLVAVTTAGALLAVLLVLLRRAVSYAVTAIPAVGRIETLPRVLRGGEPLPYGVAIAVGALAVIAR